MTTSETRPRVGVTAARGFRASAVECGIRKKGRDLALLVSDVPATAACVFTRNQVQAAPILACRESLRLSGGRARAVVINAGNANACTGEAGLLAARRTAVEAARLLDVNVAEVLVASTGVIGQQLPVEKLLAGLPAATEQLAVAGGDAAARAIMTTDLVQKESGRVFITRGGAVTIGGMAKGSGMIHPDMATTLAFVTTDAAVDADMLRRCLRRATDLTFNRISVDGDTSTNDMIALLANGASGASIGEDEEPAFLEALTAVLHELALAVARDGEGATKLITVTVTGAETEPAALQVARTIAGSALVKTAIHGCDANWGRIVAAVGRAGVPVHPERFTVKLGAVEVLSPCYRSSFSEEDALKVLQERQVEISVDLGMGSESASVWTCDLTKGYIDINASYR